LKPQSGTHSGTGVSYVWNGKKLAFFDAGKKNREWKKIDFFKIFVLTLLGANFC
jgi:hypothetical protein